MLVKKTRDWNAFSLFCLDTSTSLEATVGQHIWRVHQPLHIYNTCNILYCATYTLLGSYNIQPFGVTEFDWSDVYETNRSVEIAYILV